MITLKSVRVYLGLDIHHAFQVAKLSGHYIRIVEKDGETIEYKKDNNPNRINVVIEDSQIIKIVSVG